MADIDNLRKLGTVKKFNAGDFIFREGEPGTDMFIIISGKVEVFINSSEGLPIKVSEIAQGSFFGEMSLFEDLPRSATVIAVSETNALTINKMNIEAFIKGQPSLAYKIMKGLSSRIRSLNNEIKSIKHGDSSAVKEITNPQATKIKNSPNNQSKLRDSLFPSNHKLYKTIVPEIYKQYLFDKEVDCPVCNKHFNVQMQRLSKLKLNRVEYDFRKIFVDFEPLWYTLWVCPECYYTNFYNEFNTISDKAAKQLKENLPALKELYTPQFSSARNIDQVFTEFFMAMYCAKYYNANSLKFGKIWIQLSWLYKDMNDMEMYKEASSIALSNYYNAIYKDQLNITAEQEQQLFLILGELYLVKGDNEDARKFLYSAIKRSGGNPAYNQQAQDRLQEVKGK